MLRAAVPEGTEHQRLLTCDALTPFVAHFWWVSWDLAEPVTVETLPHPCVHLTFETPAQRDELLGVRTKLFQRELSGRGRVFGIKFRPASFYAFLGRPLASLTDRASPLPEALGLLGLELAQRLREARGFSEAIAAAEPLLVAAAPVLPSEVADTRDLVESCEHDRSLLRVEDAARASKLEIRTLERRFREYVGVSPKWVIRRYRLIDAAERIREGEHGSFAELAASLGYFDQSHFVRDFKALVGRAPSELRDSLGE